MKANVYKREKCRLCNSSDVVLAVPMNPIPITEKYLDEDNLSEDFDLYNIDLYLCNDCGHVQIFDIIDPLVLWDNYSFRSSQVQTMVEHLHGIAKDTISNFSISKNGLAVDIGSNDGTLLQEYKKHGMSVLGIDPAKSIAEEAIDAGIPTIIDFFKPETADLIVREHGKAEVVTCFNAFAHADNLNELAKGIQKILSPEGIFVFEVQYLADLIDDMLLGAIIHEHLSHHSLKPMAAFLNRNEMELISVSHNSYQGGSIVGIAQLKGSKRQIDKSVSEMIEKEITYGYDSLPKIKSLSDRLISLKTKLGQLIVEWHSKGKILAGYGAARSGPTLIAQLGIGKDIEFIVDDHPQKVNRYTPGDKIKVLPTEKLLERMPEYTVILAWVHSKKIVRDNVEYLERGGNFVVCCPDILVITKNNFQNYIG